MKIFNKRGNITSNSFKQLYPVPNPDDPLTNIFPLIDGQTNQYVNETTKIRLNQDSINYYPLGTIFTIQAEVNNDCGDRSISLLNLAKEALPTIGDATVSCPSTPCRVQEDILVNLTGDWYNSVPSSMDLFIAIYFELSDERRVVGYLSSWEQKTFSFTLPILSNVTEPNLSVNLLIIATNLEDLSATLNKTLILNNTLDEIKRQNLYENLKQENNSMSPLESSANFYPSCIYDQD